MNNAISKNTNYAVIKKADLVAFIKEIYFFIMENRVADKLNERDKCIWTF